LIVRARYTARPAAWIASAIFLFPPISGVTALIAKDGLMAGFLVLGIAALIAQQPKRALLFMFLASLMRWNALAATFPPIVLMLRWRYSGWRRYLIAFAAWAAVTFGALGVNVLLTDEEEHIWYWTSGYEDIAGTLEYMGPVDDATLAPMLEGMPLLVHDHLWDAFHARYDPINFYQLMRGPDRILDPPKDERERTAVRAAWRGIVLGHFAEFLAYRWENYRLLIRLDRPPTFSNVYVWLTVIAAPETIDELEHDAYPSRIQRVLCDGSIWISLTPLYHLFVYLIACFVLLPLCLRRSLEASLMLSAIGYQLAWFYLAASSDVRYSTWMIVCAVTALALRLRASRPTSRSGSSPAP
jgi:hypothetical protein